MLNGRTIAVVVPAYNEERQIISVLETMPSFVDRIIVVNDCSCDRTEDVVLQYIQRVDNTGIPLEHISQMKRDGRYEAASRAVIDSMVRDLDDFPPSEVLNADDRNERVILISLRRNSGVGAAIARGYKWCVDHRIDCTAVMAGDGQMDPAELESICRPVIEERIDYVKGNRLIHAAANTIIPTVRLFGNSVLSILTKIASGYWHVSDTQTGYTAISRRALESIRIQDIYPSYGMPNDMLVRLNIAFCTIREVEIKPVYNVGERSKMRIAKVIPRISLLLLRGFFRRLWGKYLLRDFHPLFLLYHFSFALILAWVPYLVKVGILVAELRNVSFETLFAFTFLGISGFLTLLFAMWMDIQDNERLYR